MIPVHHHAVRLLTGVFVLGCAGCLIAIPVIAYKFASVLFEKNEEESAVAGGESSTTTEAK